MPVGKDFKGGSDMPHLPAICDRCGVMFPSGFVIENAINITLSGNQSGPCPACGGMGHIPDGLYNFIGNSIELLQGPTRTVTELQRLAAALRDARARKSDVAEIQKTLTDASSELQSIADILPKNRTELYAFLGLLIAVITLILSMKEKDKPVNIHVDQVINMAVKEASPPLEKSQGTTTASSATVKSKSKVGRNEPCPCGSGKKYKRCHGQ